MEKNCYLYLQVLTSISLQQHRTFLKFQCGIGCSFSLGLFHSQQVLPHECGIKPRQVTHPCCPTPFFLKVSSLWQSRNSNPLPCCWIFDLTLSRIFRPHNSAHPATDLTEALQLLVRSACMPRLSESAHTNLNSLSHHQMSASH